MTAHWEVLRTDAPQPWHARLISGGHTIATTENYTRMVGAERAILAAARAHGWMNLHLVWNVKGAEKVFAFAWGDPPPLPSVKYLDERASAVTS